jgi:hypothetical protein
MTDGKPSAASEKRPAPSVGLSFLHVEPFVFEIRV